eukprot:7755697-Alexandrium_andersonii.AAC.1
MVGRGVRSNQQFSRRLREHAPCNGIGVLAGRFADVRERGAVPSCALRCALRLRVGAGLRRGASQSPLSASEPGHASRTTRGRRVEHNSTH